MLSEVRIVTKPECKEGNERAHGTIRRGSPRNVPVKKTKSKIRWRAGRREIITPHVLNVSGGFNHCNYTSIYIHADIEAISK